MKAAHNPSVACANSGYASLSGVGGGVIVLDNDRRSIRSTAVKVISHLEDKVMKVFRV